MSVAEIAGRYRLQGRLGLGGMSTVHLAVAAQRRGLELNADVFPDPGRFTDLDGNEHQRHTGGDLRHPR